MGHKLEGLSIFQTTLGFQGAVYPCPTLQTVIYTVWNAVSNRHWDSWNHPCSAGRQMKDAGRWDPHLEELTEAGPLLAVGNRGTQGKELIRCLVSLLCYCWYLCSRAHKCPSTALINKFPQSIFNMNMWGFPSPNIMLSNLCPKQAKKLNYFFNSSFSAQKWPAQTPQKETMWHILYFLASIYLHPKLSSHSPLISIS